MQLLEIPGLFVTETALPMIDEFIFIRTSRLNGFFGTNFLTIKEYYYYLLKIVTSLEKLVFVLDIVTYYLLLNKIKLKMNWSIIVYFCWPKIILYGYIHFSQKNIFCKTDITIYVLECHKLKQKQRFSPLRALFDKNN